MGAPLCSSKSTFVIPEVERVHADSEITHSASTTSHAKRRKLSSTKGSMDSEVSGANNIVVWRTPAHDAFRGPVVDHGSGDTVAILKDWRERTNQRPAVRSDSTNRTTKTTFAVIVERSWSTDQDEGYVSLAKKSIKSTSTRQADEGTRINETTGTKPSKAKIETKRGRANNAKNRPALIFKENAAETAESEGKGPLLSGEEDEHQAPKGDLAQPRKRKPSEPKPTIPPVLDKVASVPKGRKRKAPEPEKHSPPSRVKRGKMR